MTRLTVLALLAVLAGGAAVPDQAASPQVQEGRRLAQKYCAGCHGAGPAQISPHRGAPPFWMLDGLHTPESLQHTAASGERHSRYGMSGIVLTRSEAAAILSYIEAVARADHATQRKMEMTPCIATAPC
ncbi:c-type cytochrome [Phenylobacterium sp.]|uniref:c-type cytochrome n=1 Tax=Phenylobacterium sp. TaxID=1871053 RepID=UPI0035AF01E7